MKVRILLCTFAFSIASLALALDPAKSVPSSFHGKWSEKIDDCKQQESEGDLTLSSNKMAFYASGGSVKKVFVNNPLDIIVVANLSGEGETWLSNIHLRLSHDKTSLVDISYKEPFIRYRCLGHSP